MLFVQMLSSNPKLYVMWVLLVIISVSLHESAHAFIAKINGDSTACDNGYLFNPLKQMGINSIIAILIIGISWGAVPVDYRRLKYKNSHVFVAIAGPLTNLLLFILFSIVSVVIAVKFNAVETLAFRFFFTGAVLNFVLFIFNMIPVPPLDGWIIFLSIFPRIHRMNQELRNGIFIGLFFLVIFSFGQFYVAGQYVVVSLMRVLSFLIT